MKDAICETVLITGASSGIGLELAKCFAADGCKLILLARNQNALKNLAEELRRAHKIQTIVLTADLSPPETPKRIFNELSAQNISVDILVNNAGFGASGAFADLPLSRQLEMLQVNIVALTELTRLFLPGMIKRKRGGILNVASVAGFLTSPNMAIYYATKAFVLSFTEALAEELSETNLTVSVLCPGPTETNFGKIARGEKARPVQISKMPAKTVARIGHRDFRNRKIISVPGFKNRVLIFLIRLFPRRFVCKITKFYNRAK
ncbi:MAG: SDR family NAD(P)-dependent oxidoreductase [Limisphaerales bacterium]